MKENKNIDRLFQEKFKDFEAHPSDRVWNSIAASQQIAEQPKVIPFWWRVGGIAAALIILLTIGGGIVITSNTSDTPQIVNQTPSQDQENQETIHTPLNNGTSTLLQEEKSNGIAKTTSQSESTDDNPLVNNISQKANVSQEAEATSQKTLQQYTSSSNNNNPPSQINNTSPAIAINNNPDNSGHMPNDNATSYTSTTNDDSNTLRRERSSSTGNDFERKTTTTGAQERNNTNVVGANTENTAIAATDKDDDTSKKDLILEAQKIEEAKTEEAIVEIEDSSPASKWNVGAIATPVYYGDFGGSGLDKQFSDNEKSGDVNLSYGVQISYAVSPKLKVRTGINTLDLSYATDGISFSSGQFRSSVSSSFERNISTLAITDSGNSPNSLLLESFNPSSAGTLEQRLNYLEIPMEAVYTISDKRVGLSVIGGISTLLLNNNEVILTSEDLTTDLGSSSSVNGVSFSTNIGLGIDYKMTDKLQLNVEPSFKYQLNGFDDNVVDFQPFYLGVSTGVSYKF